MYYFGLPPGPAESHDLQYTCRPVFFMSKSSAAPFSLGRMGTEKGKRWGGDDYDPGAAEVCRTASVGCVGGGGGERFLVGRLEEALEGAGEDEPVAQEFAALFDGAGDHGEVVLPHERFP